MMNKITNLVLLSVGISTFPLFIEQALAVSCNDFYVREYAQELYYSSNDYNDELDPDSDGWACEHLARSYSDLTKETWNELLYHNRQRKLESNNKLSLTYAEVNQIIGFAPNNELKNGRHV